METAIATHRFTGGLTHATTARFPAAGSGRALIR
jgi:hypothetical protein